MAETVKQPEAKRGNRKERVGEVVSNKMAKTIVVKVERRFPHAQYKKIITAYKKLYAHDEKNEAKIGDRVRTESNVKAWLGQRASQGHLPPVGFPRSNKFSG